MNPKKEEIDDNNNIDYGICDQCNYPLKPIWFIEKEYKTNHGHEYPTGRVRKAVDYLICPSCLEKYCIDDTLDDPWY